MLKYSLIYELYTGMAKVLQNGVDVGDFSRFRRIISNPFVDWFDDFPQMCDAEANGEYEVEVTGPQIIYYLVFTVFRMSGNSLCKGIKHIPYKNNITVDQKMKWLNEMGKKLSSECGHIGINISIMNSETDEKMKEVFSENRFMKVGTDGEVINYPDSPIRININKDKNSSDDICITDMSVSNSDFEEGMFHLVIGSCDENWSIDRVDGSVIYVKCDKKQMRKLIELWFVEMIFPMICQYIIDVMKGSSTYKKMDRYDKEKIRMLNSDIPFVEIEVPKKVEISENPVVKIIKLPDNLDISIESSNESIVRVSNNIIYPVGEGNAVITARSTERSGVKAEQKISVFKYRKVTGISLQASSKQVKCGEIVKVTESFMPSNANNIGKKKESISPSGILQSIGNGKYKSLKSGMVTIRVEVEGVSQETVITVYDAPKSVKFEEKCYSVKHAVGKLNLKANVYPIGCKGGNVKYRVGDGSVLDVNDVTGKITTKREGKTKVYAILTDSNGCIVDETSCEVIVKPTIDVLVIDEFLLVFIAFAIGMIFFRFFWVKAFFALAGVISLIIYGWKRRRKLDIYISIGFGVLLIGYMIYVIVNIETFLHY